MVSALQRAILSSRQKTLKAKPRLNLVEWADTYRYLSAESSSTPGKWKTDRVEPARGPMLAVTEPGVREITIMGCTQLMKTEFINNIVAYYIHQSPAPLIVMQPTISMAHTWSKDRLSPMIRDTQVIRELIGDKKSRDSNNTLERKGFPGGFVVAIGSNSTTELAGRPVQVVLADEIDKYENSAEGDPLKLIAERTATFWNSLIIKVCSPTIKGTSRIEQSYETSDKRVFTVPCPGCGHRHEMQFANVKWSDDDPETAAYMCPECGMLWDEVERQVAIKQGYYVATAPFKGHAGFKVSKLASPWEGLNVLVKKWLEAQGDVQKLKAFVNTQLAETWEESGERPEYMRLYERREPYPFNSAPKGVGIIVAGADVQKDRIEVEVAGYGRGKESWSIDYRIIMGDTSTEKPWLELDKLLNESWTLANGRTEQIRALAVDTGYNTQHVYNWARNNSTSGRVLAVDGRAEQYSILGSPKPVDVNHSGKRIRRGLKLWPVGTDTAKLELYSWLFLDGAGDDGIYPAGFCHFPEYEEEHFKQLTGEQLVTRMVNGKETKRFVRTHTAVERLDCRVYARAAASYVGMDRFKDHDWEQLLGKREEKVEPTTTPNTKPEPRKYFEAQKPAPSSIWGRGPKKSIW